jgi:hypothetical protein
MRPSIDTYYEQDKNNFQFDYYFNFNLPFEYWINRTNPLNDIENLINSSISENGIDLHNIKFSISTSYIKLNTNTNENTLLYVLPNELIKEFLLLSGINKSDLSFNNVLAITEGNLDKNIPFQFNPIVVQNYSMNLNIISSLAREELLTYSKIYSTLFSSNLNSFFLVTDIDTFMSIEQKINNEDIDVFSYYSFSPRENYELIYFQKNQKVPTKILEEINFKLNSATIKLASSGYSRLNEQERYNNSILAVDFFWGIIIIILILLIAFLVINSINLSFENFKKIIFLLEIKGLSQRAFALLYFTEICILTIILVFTSKFLSEVFLGLLFYYFRLDQSRVNLGYYSIDYFIFTFLVLIFFYLLKWKSIFPNLEDLPLLSALSQNIIIGFPENKTLSKKDYIIIFLSIIDLIFMFMFLFFEIERISIEIYILIFISLNCIIIAILLPSIILPFFKLLYNFIENISKKKDFFIPGIQINLLKLDIRKITSKIRILMIVVVITIGLLSCFTSFISSSNEFGPYSLGSQILIKSNNYNSTMEKTINNLNNNSGVSITTILNSYNFGSDVDLPINKYNILLLNCSTYLSLENLNSQRLQLSEDYKNLISKLNQSYTILANFEFLNVRNLNIDSKINIKVQSSNENNFEEMKSFTIIGSFKLWPGFIQYPIDTNYSENAIIMSFKTFELIKNISSVKDQIYNYLVNPSIGFNYTSFNREYPQIPNNFYQVFYGKLQPNQIDLLNYLIFFPFTFATIVISTLLIFKNYYEFEKYYLKRKAHYAILRALGMHNGEIGKNLLLQYVVTVIFILISFVLGLIFGYCIIEVVSYANILFFPIMLIINFNNLIEILIIFFWIFSIEPFFLYKKITKDNIVRIVSIED